MTEDRESIWVCRNKIFSGLSGHNKFEAPLMTILPGRCSLFFVGSAEVGFKKGIRT